MEDQPNVELEESLSAYDELLVRERLAEPAARSRLAAEQLLLVWALNFRRGEVLAFAVAELRQHLGFDDGENN